MDEHEHDSCCEAGEKHDHDHGDGEPDCCEHSDNPWQTRSLILAGCLVAGTVFMEWTGIGPSVLEKSFAAAAMLAGGWFLLPGVWDALRRFRPSITLLTVLAAIGATVVGQLTEGATVIFLFGVAEWLEGWADQRARRAVRALLELSPETAMVKTASGSIETPVDKVDLGTIVLVKNGEKIPLDGVITAGNSAVNQAPITGESVPVEKKPGGTVFAGTINGGGALEVRVTKAAGDTVLARIIKLVEEAQEKRAPMQRFVDVFARYYTPTVAVAAFAVLLIPPLFFGGIWDTWVYRACILLIIACPCALVISTPVSIVAGLTALARRGVLVKGGQHLESVGRLTALALDKTGTLTEGKPRVLGIKMLSQIPENDLVRIAAAIESQSSHPLAMAIVNFAKERNLPEAHVENGQSLAGRGANGTLDGHAYFVGNHRYTHELGVCSPEIEGALAEIEGKGQSVVVVGHKPHEGCKGETLGIIAVGDAVRKDARQAVAALHEAGVKKVVMLSGDNQRTAGAIAREVGIDETYGDLLPEAKVEALKKLMTEFTVVGMVGDGVNDAPAMATATIGIAMGTAGTDAAIETADITLMQDNLGAIAGTVRLGRRTLGIIRFNITFALGLKAVFLGLALTGHTSLWLAIMADTGATLVVVANSLRLLRD